MMHPFYHPTSVLVLDDDPLFLESFNFQFSDELTCQAFTRPDTALEHLRAQESQHPRFGRYFAPCSGSELGWEASSGDQLLRLQVSQIRSMIADQSRYERISVAVVDFDMPKMTGVQFCRAMRDLPVKTILLTGKAGLETAINAFNERVIDCFLQKQDPNVSVALRGEIRRLQSDYFHKVSCPLNSALSLQDSKFLSDRKFVELFEEFRRNHGVVEHYVCAAPPGILMFDNQKNPLFLLVSDPDMAMSHAEVAEAQNAPADLLQLLKTRKAMAWFPTKDGYYDPRFATDWMQYVWPAQELTGNVAWTYSLVRSQGPNDLAFGSLLTPVSSHAS